jgi:hypothetical protein
MRTIVFGALFALGFPAGAIADDYLPCVDSKSIVGECLDIRGRVSLHNGNPSVRIWPVGSKRLLGVRDAEPLLLPPELRKSLTWDHYLFAHLKVCPLTKASEGRMQVVCIASARNAVTREK